MLKRGAAFFTILSFAVFSTACVYWPTREIRNEGDYPAPGRKVARVVKANGEVVDFTGPGLGQVLIDKVQGPAVVSVERTVELKEPLGLVKKRADGTVSEITDASGWIHYVLSIEKEGSDSVIIKERRTETQVVSIPLSEVRLIQYRKTNAILTAMALAAVAAAGIIVLVAIGLSQSMWHGEAADARDGVR
jgi:hypothetical protein